MTSPDAASGDLLAQVDTFATETVSADYQDAPRHGYVKTEQLKSRFSLAAGTDRSGPIFLTDSHQGWTGLPHLVLTAHGDDVATLTVNYQLALDSHEQYLAVARSHFHLHSSLDRMPLLRLEYGRDMHTVPSAHWQVVAERGALSHLLAKTGAPNPHSLQSLHLPVGGRRYRPCLEDFLQFLIQECGIDARNGWQAAVKAGRVRWHQRQLAAVVRDAPDEAAHALRALGYSVAPPEAGPPPGGEGNSRLSW